jgi:diacylglycerol kinase (ATP)
MSVDSVTPLGYSRASPDDGRLEVGVAQRGRRPGRDTRPHGRLPGTLAARPGDVRDDQGKLNRKVLYEVDGGDRKKVKSFTVNVQPAAITICLPKESEHNDNGGT